MVSIRTTIFSQLKEFPYFTRENVSLLSSKFNISDHSIDSYIKLGIKNKEIVKLNKKYFVTNSYYELHKSDISYNFFLANKFKSPSYVSLESALQHYGLFTEAVNIVKTSITTKIPKSYKNQLGIYSYRKIKPELFIGYKLEKGNFEYLIAEPYKAVFDYLYYRTYKFRKKFDESIFEELRIDIEFLKEKDKRKLKSLIKKHGKVDLNL